MKNLETIDIQESLDKLTVKLEEDENFISVFFTEEDRFVITTTTGKLKFPFPDTATIYNAEITADEAFAIEVVKGIPVTSAIGDDILHKPLISTEGATGQMGGDWCKNVNSKGWGTISFYTKTVSVEGEGGCIKKCTSAPGMVSNNHVIGRNGAAKPGEVIRTEFHASVAKLNCIMPYKCNTSIDYASANVIDIKLINPWELRGIGKLNKIAKPKIGQRIRKSGARSGLTTGKITGMGNIRNDLGFMFYKIFSTSRGFGCPGDSGSSVVNDTNDLLGIFSWGESGKDCKDNPIGYFWPILLPKKSADNKVEWVSNILIDEE